MKISISLEDHAWFARQTESEQQSYLKQHPHSKLALQRQSKVRNAVRKAWHVVSEPFVAAWKIATDKKYRQKTAHQLGSALKKEGRETKHMAQTFVKMLKGHEVSKEDKHKAVHQLADVAKVVMLGALVTHVAAGGIAKLAATIASPLDEIAGITLDGPMRVASKRVFGIEHGILPSAFYEDHGEPATAADTKLTTDEAMAIDEMSKRFVEALATTQLTKP